jgi:RNA-directed DNA polymerase
MSQLLLLRGATSIQDVATLLQFQAKAVAYIIYKKPIQNRYKSFEISKRNGGIRKISAPAADLRLLQQRLSDLLQNCIEEINDNKKLKNKKFKDDLAHGFKRKKSIITNAKKHQRRKYVFNVDIEDFFPSINFGRVRGFFIKDANFMLHTKVATILAQIACHEGVLPQGSPCSPVISNLVGHVLDIHLCKLASANGCTYSRYADDLTFSTNKPIFPIEIAKPVPAQADKWEVGDKLKEAILHSGFAINSSKTRMQYRNSRQSVTGLVVNRKVNVRTEYRRTVRAMAQTLFMTGKFQRLWMVPDATGKSVATMTDATMEQLHGMLGHIDKVDLHNFEIDSELESQVESAKEALRSKEKLYRRFLMFKVFYAATKPVIVCEGKTDNVYIDQAIRSLAVKFPKLATVTTKGEVGLNVRILKTVNSSTGRILELLGGTEHFHPFIRQYLIELERFKAPGKQNAVVLVVDNDPAGLGVYKTIAKLTKKKASATADFAHVAGNLYAVLTPLKGGAQTSIIEDCFADAVLKATQGGKTFDPNNNFDPATHFGKHVLSVYVRDNASKIDFSGFEPLLQRISAAIVAHESMQARVTVSSAISTP